MSITESHFPNISVPENAAINYSAESNASEKIWNRYFERLLRFATFQMRGMSKSVADEEDIALSVLESVCLRWRECEDGGASCADDSGIWNFLVLICKRKIANQHAYQQRGKRAVSRSQSLFNDPALLEELHSTQIQPAQVLEFNESLERLFALLEKDVLQKVALAKVQGYTNHEIAEQMDCSLSTVERKLRLIREIWSCECESK